MAVPEQTPYIEYTGNGSTTSFPLTFDCDNPDHLLVTINDTDAVVGSWSLNSGSVIFTAPPANNALVVFKRSSPILRTASYTQYDNSFRPTPVNKDFDRIWLKLQELGVEDWLLWRGLAAETSARILADKIERETRISEDIRYNQLSIDRDNALQAFLIGKINDVYASLTSSLAIETAARINGDAQTALSAREYIDLMLRMNASMTMFDGIADNIVMLPSGRTQRDKNSENVSLKDKGGIGSNANDTLPLLNAIAQSIRVALNTDMSVIRQAIINKAVHLDGPAELVQDTLNQHTIAAGFASGTAGNLNGTLVKGMKFTNMKFGAMPDATADDFAALCITAGDGAVSFLNMFKGTENAILAAVSDGKWAVPGYGARDTLSLGDYVESAKRFSFQNIQASFTRIIGMAAHSNGDNTTIPSGGVNNGGFNGGIRLAGIARGNIVAASNIRDKYTAVDIQKGCHFNVLTGSYFENSYSNTLNISSGTLGCSYGNVHSGFVIRNAGAAGIRLRHSNTTRIDGMIYGTGKVTPATGDGVDAINSSGSATEQYRIIFTGGSGTVPAAGTIITMGTASATLVAVDGIDLQTVAAGATMPATGEILVKDLTGDFFGTGALAGITANAVLAYSCDGRHRIDVTVADASSLGLRLGSSSNLAKLISVNGKAGAADIGGKFNIVDIVIAENATATHLFVTGNNNIVRVTDNTIVARTSISITGSNNIVTANVNGSVSVAGSANTLTVDCKALNNGGNNNVFSGRCTSLTKGAGTGNKYDGLHRAVYRGTVTATTDASGNIALTHDCIVAATSVHAAVVGTMPYLVTTVNAATNLTTSTIRVYSANGTALASTSVTLDVMISI